MPKSSTADLLLYSSLGSVYYHYEKPGTPGVMENAEIMINWRSNWLYANKLRFSLAVDYRGFNFRQFCAETKDYIRPFTIFAGIRYYYLTTNYSMNPKQ